MTRTDTAVTGTLFRWMVREEWRLHSHLFGGARFAAFPLVVAVLTGVGAWLLPLTGTPMATVAGGLVALVGFFGLQVGTIGLVGRDALRDVLGDVTLLVFSARTLPLSWRRLLATFLLKDVCYYTGFVLTPAVVGYGAVAVASGTTPASVALLWLAVVAAFAFGASLSLALVAVATRSRLAFAGALVGGTLAVVGLGLDPVAYTPYALYADPSAATVGRGVTPTLALAALGVALFRPVDDAGSSRHRATERLFTGVRDPLTRQSLLSVTRSSGSVGKVVFSMGVLFAVTALLLDRVTAATGVRPQPGVAFGTLLGLGAFTTYSWVTQFDSPRSYLRYPVAYADVFAGTLRAYLVLSLSAAAAYLAAATLWYPVRALAVGLLVVPGVAVYVFGVAAYLTGLAPNELLFDTALFAAFGAALAALAVPLLVAALVVSVAPLAAVAAAVGLATLAGGVGWWLTGRAGPRWAEKLQS
ncbi:hypothetical protein [Haloarcula onubensis]|uniref:ABC-2 type transport system permease protein n=1 Tax=Haloarcula onubensis TaxID=2950539 RepID=A0ABU2FLP4_9EURY|nr:hypothetical protein [Halomicroarcula sp. S3CR25-11]MDS0281684.1 hypothetical protein [Halomicroarcula sp. S3CR25-11]